MSDPNDTPPVDPDADPADERIRFCLACGEAVPFVQVTCPACGHHDAAVAALAADPPPTARCVACSAALAPSGHFCPRCGSAQSEPRLPPPVDSSSLDVPPDRIETAAVVLVIAAPVIAAAALLLAYAFAPST